MAAATYRVTIGDRVLEVAVRDEGGQLFARVGDAPEREVRLDRLRGGACVLGVGAERRELLADRSGGTVRLVLDGIAYEAQVEDARRAALAGTAGGPGAQHHPSDLRAPMPGLVVKVLCQPGEVVERGQPLVVLQAMKMENELSLPRGGTVVAVNVEPGQTVDQGQILITLE